jgi:hypothetical protein
MRAFIIRRLREPSTWLGLAALAGVVLPPGASEALAVGAGALLGVLLPERKPEA